MKCFHQHEQEPSPNREPKPIWFFYLIVNNIFIEKHAKHCTELLPWPKGITFRVCKRRVNALLYLLSTVEQSTAPPARTFVPDTKPMATLV